jgi:hypothetical protein
VRRPPAPTTRRTARGEAGHLGLGVGDLIQQPGQRALARQRLKALGVRGYLSPVGGERRPDFDVEPQSVRVADDERLLRVGVRPCRLHGAVGQRERVGVPVQPRELVRQGREHRVRGANRGPVDGQHADLEAPVRSDARAEAGREQLRSKADPHTGVPAETASAISRSSSRSHGDRSSS